MNMGLAKASICMHIQAQRLWNLLARMTAHPNTIVFRMCLPAKECVAL